MTEFYCDPLLIQWFAEFLQKYFIITINYPSSDIWIDGWFTLHSYWVVTHTLDFIATAACIQ